MTWVSDADDAGIRDYYDRQLARQKAEHEAECRERNAKAAQRCPACNSDDVGRVTMSRAVAGSPAKRYSLCATCDYAWDLVVDDGYDGGEAA